uniref:Trophinin associated protein n=2 Tax=Oryctolagus cuniculus TaxID=9986 RepID=A0A5F9DFA2_RABIT
MKCCDVCKALSNGQVALATQCLLAAVLVVIRTTVSQASGLLLETPVQPASSLPEGEQEVVSHSDEGGGGPLGLAQRIPLREIQEITHTKDGQHSHLVPSPAPVTLPMPGRVAPPPVARPSPFGRAQRVPSPGASAATTSYSMLRRFTMRPKTRFTPIPSAPRVQQARWLRGLSPQSCQEEPALSWGQIAVQLFDQETSGELQEGPGDPLAAPPAVHSSGVPRLQELKMQRISVLQQLLRQEVEGLAGDKCVPLHGAPSLDMTELQPVLAEISRTVDVLEPASGTSRFHSELPQPCLPQGAQETRPCPATEPATPESCRGEVPEPSPQDQPRTPEPCPPVEPCPQGQARAPEACPRVEQAPSEACSLPPSPQPSCSQGAPATTSLTFSSQRPLCASPPIHSLQSPRPLAGQAGKRWVTNTVNKGTPLSHWALGPPCCLYVPPSTLPQPGSAGSRLGAASLSPVLLVGSALEDWESSPGVGSRGRQDSEMGLRALSQLSVALRPQQAGPASPGPETAPQSLSKCHLLLPRGPAGRRVRLLHQPSPSHRPQPGVHQPCGHTTRMAGCPGEPPPPFSPPSLAWPSQAVWGVGAGQGAGLGCSPERSLGWLSVWGKGAGLCDRGLLSVSRVSSQLVLLPCRTLHPESPASTCVLLAFLAPIYLPVCSRDWKPKPFCPLIKFLKCPDIQLVSLTRSRRVLFSNCPHGGSVPPAGRPAPGSPCLETAYPTPG